MSNPVYMAIGSLTVADFAASDTGFKVEAARLPEPESDGHGGHEPAVREFEIQVTGTTKATVRSSIASLRRECVRDKMLYFQTDSASEMLSCRIREASVVEAAHDHLLWNISEPLVMLTVTLTTDPYWLAPWGDEVDASGDITYIPGHFDIPDPGGEVDALLSMRVVPAVEGTGLFVGVKPDPSSDYDYLDDYGEATDTADANAYGGYKLVSASNLSSSMAALWSPPSLVSGANQGRHIALARLDSTAASPTDASVQIRTTTTGHAIVASTSVDEQEIPLATADLVGIELGTIAIPSAGLPAVDVPSGSVADSEGNAVDDGTLTLTSTVGPAPYYLQWTQTFATFNGYLESITYTIDTTVPEPEYISNAYVYIRDASGTVRHAEFDIDLTVGEHTITLPVPIPMTSGQTWALWFYVTTDEWATQQITLGLAHSNGDYADGALTVSEGSGASAGDDLTFAVSGMTNLGFVSSTSILASTDEAFVDAYLDYVQRIPADYALLAYRLSASGSLGLYYDASTDTPYVADDDGIGPSVFDDCTINKPLRVKPGVTNRVVLGIVQGDVAVGGVSALAYRVRKRYLSATG